MSEREWRVDAQFQTSEAERTEEGFIHTTGTIAKPGIMIYKRPDGSTYRELVPRALLQDADYQRSHAGKPFIDEHPKKLKLKLEDVNKERPLCGSVGAAFWDDALDSLRLPLHFTTPHGVKQYESGKRYLSPAYPVIVDRTPGVDPEFGEYDTKQVWRGPANHVALTHTPRGGIDMAADSNTSVQVTFHGDSEQAPATPPAQPAAPAQPQSENAPAWAMSMSKTLEKILEVMTKQAAPQADEGGEEKPGEKPGMNADSVNALVQERTEVIQLATTHGLTLDTSKSTLDLKRQILKGRFEAQLNADSSEQSVNVLWSVFKSEAGSGARTSPTASAPVNFGNALLAGAKMRADSARAEAQQHASGAQESVQPVTLTEIFAEDAE